MIADREILQFGISGIIRAKMKSANSGDSIMFEPGQVKSIETLRVLVSRCASEMDIRLSVKEIDNNYYVIRV